MHAQIAESRVAVDEVARRLGDDHLSTVCGCGDSRSPVDVDPYIALRCDEWLTGMNSDPHAWRASGKSLLPLARRLDSIAGPRERIEERVSLRIHLDAPALGERGAERTSMLGENVRVLVTEFVQEQRGALDVGEEEGNCARWEGAHGEIIECGIENV